MQAADFRNAEECVWIFIPAVVVSTAAIGSACRIIAASRGTQRRGRLLVRGWGSRSAPMKHSLKRAWFALLAAGFAACTPPWSRPALPEPQPPPADQAVAQDSPAKATDRALRASIPSYVGLGFSLEGQL